MAGLAFESLSTSVYAGAPVRGVLRLDAARPLRARDFRITLRGLEETQVTVRRGKHSTVYTHQEVFLEQVIPLRQFVTAPLDETIPAGRYSLPFQFILPPGTPPTLSAGRRGHGAWIRYGLEARVDVPWWPDPVAMTSLAVFPPHQTLGRAPGPIRGSRSWAGESKAELLVGVDQGLVEAGKPFTGEFRISNPELKTIRKATVSLARVVEWHTRGRKRAMKGPVYEWVKRIGSKPEHLVDRFTITVPPSTEATVAWDGRLIRVWWMFGVKLDVAWGFDANVEVPLPTR